MVYNKEMKGRKPFIAIEHIGDFNRLKRSLFGQTFTREFLKNELKNIGIIYNDWFINNFIKYNLIKEVSRFEFVFTDEKPTHYELLEKAYIDYASAVNKYVTNTIERRKKEEIENKIKESVSFLKSLGYELYAPVGDLYSKL